MERKVRGPRQSPRSVCLPTARSSKFMLARASGVSAGFAVAEPAAMPEDRQSERSEVCRDREKGKYLLPEGRACRRGAVVRRVPEAGRKSFGMVPVPGASKRSEVAPGNGTPWEEKSRRAEAVTAKRVSAAGPELKIHV